MLSNSPANCIEHQEIEKADRAARKGAGAKPYTRRYLILHHWHLGRSIEGIALELTEAGYSNTSCKSIARALNRARDDGYKVAPSQWKPRTDPTGMLRADLGKFERPAIPDGAAQLLGYEAFGLYPELADLADPQPFLRLFGATICGLLARSKGAA